MIVDDQFQTRNSDLRFRNKVSARINCAQRIVRTHRHTCVRIFCVMPEKKGKVVACVYPRAILNA